MSNHWKSTLLNISRKCEKKKSGLYAYKNFQILKPHQWPSCSALKTGSWEIPGGIPVGASQPNRSEFFVV